MKICYLSWIIVIIGCFMIIGDTYTFSGKLNLAGNIIYVTVLVILTNLTCYSTNYVWVAWLIIIIHFVALIGMLSLLLTKSKEEVKKIVGGKDGFLNRF